MLFGGTDELEPVVPAVLLSAVVRYAWLMIDGEDLVIMCPTSQGGLNNHDTNLITLHHIQDFRQLPFAVLS